jgi:hypothetical protein
MVERRCHRAIAIVGHCTRAAPATSRDRGVADALVHSEATIGESDERVGVVRLFGARFEV